MDGSQAKFITPEELLFPAQALDTLYLRVVFALKERAVEQLIAPSTCFFKGILSGDKEIADHRLFHAVRGTRRTIDRRIVCCEEIIFMNFCQ